MPTSSLVLLHSLPLTPRRHRQASGQLSQLYPPLAKFHLVWRRLREALLTSSYLAGQKHPSLLSRVCLKCRRYKSRFCPEHKDEISYYICGHSGCAHGDVHSLNTTIVEGPIERHKSRLGSRKTEDGLTGTYQVYTYI